MLIDKKAINPCVLDLKKSVGFTDYFVICSASSAQQIKAIAAGIQAELKANGVRIEHQEGSLSSNWVLLDYTDFIVHIFTEDARGFYNLEGLWDKTSLVQF